MIRESTFYGGAEHRGPGIDFALSATSPRVQTVEPTVASLRMALPNATLMRAGGPHFYVANLSTSRSFFIDDIGGLELGEIGPEQVASISLIGNLEVNGTWFIRIKDLVGQAAGA